jgi:four helix bundle protein
MSIGSCSEAEYLILLSRDLNYLEQVDYELTVKEIKAIRQMLNGLLKKLRADSSKL